MEPAAVAALREKQERRRRDLTNMALIAEKAGRFDDMLSTMCCIAELGSGLTEVEKKLFWTSFYRYMNKKIYEWNIAADVLKAERKKDNGCAVQAAQQYRFKIEDEVKEMCNSVVDVIENHLISSSYDAETIVDFHKMVADFNYKVADLINSSVELMVNDKDYFTEAGVTERTERMKLFAKSVEAQERAWKVAQEKLPAMSHVRLTLAIDLSNMFCKLNKGARAYQLVKEAYDDAKSELKSKIWSNNTKELMSMLEFHLSMLESIDDGAYRRVLVNQEEEQSGPPEGVKQGSNPAVVELNHIDEEYYKIAREHSGSGDTSTSQ